ncbi:GDP-mannose 4,6-dehydratase [bacterium]|nr:GDP-mannose 4,6-dehydratase [bacterium]
MEKALITGANGFVGCWLVEDLLRSGCEVLGVGRVPDAASPPARLGGFSLDGIGGDGTAVYAGEAGAWRFRDLDLTADGAAADLLAEVRPDAVYHLAAQSSAALSFERPQLTFDVNVTGSLRLLEAVRALPAKDRPLLLAVGSSEEYGPTDARAPLDESAPLNPISPYGVSKVTQTLLCRQYARSFDLPVVMARPFAHTGPGQSPVFAYPSFARQIIAVERGEQEPVLRVGDLSPLRDYLHVRDVVRAYRLLREKGVPGEIYNIASGKGLSMQNGLDILLAASDSEIGIEPDPARFRPSNVPYMVGDSDKLERATGWRPAGTLADTLRELLQWTRETAE